MNAPRFLFCQYADDVRQEIGGKISLIGVYQGGLRVVGTLPVVLPKLVIVAHLVSPSEHPFTSLSFRVIWNGTVLLQIPAPEDLIRRIAESAKEASGERLAIQMVFALQPFTIDAIGKLDVVADVDGSTIEGGSLRVEVIPPESESQAEPSAAT